MKTNYLTLLGSSLLATGITLSCAMSARAFTLVFDNTSVSTNSPATGASAIADFDFSDISPNGVNLKITIENTTGNNSFGAGATQSTLVGLAFDLDDSIVSFDYDPLTSDFDRLFEPATLSGGGANQQNTFDIGFRPNAGGGNFNGGNPQGGVSANNSTMVEFDFVTNPNLTAAVLEQSFFDGFSNGTLGFAARFQQVNAGAGSDKLFGGSVIGDPSDPVDPNPQNPTDIPEPGTILSLGLLAVGTAVTTRKTK